MKHRQMKKVIYLIAFALPANFGFTSCIDTIPEEVVEYENVYRNADEADVAILGLYGQFMLLADQVVVLNELRADLMDVTPNASNDLQEINLGLPSEKNAWADVTKFYTVIQSCNDILYNFDKMLEEKKMIKAEYDERYSDVGALRCWVYLQLGIHFGTVPYITEPAVSLADLEKNSGNQIHLDRLLPELVRYMESLPTLENYATSTIPQKQDGYDLAPIFINKQMLLADLYLFNNQYDDAARLYRTIMSAGEDKTPGNNEADRKYRLFGDEAWTAGATPISYSILFDANRTQDINSMYNSWREMFAGTMLPGDTKSPFEMIWFFNYDNNFKPAYSLRKLFDPASKNGNYLLKPSSYAVENIWGAETQRNGFPFDARGLTGSYDKTGDDYYIQKYSLFDLLPSNTTKGGWYIYRAGMLHLRYAEAANRAGYPKLAWALVNDGLFAETFNFTRADGSVYPGDSVKITGDSPFAPYAFPYNFDARYADIGALKFRGHWRNNRGVRGRANLPNVNFPANCTGKQDSILFVEQLIVREAALELGFEGHRWEDLIRIARRMNLEKPGSGDLFLWDENIKKKFDRSGIAGADLSSSSKWFLPLFR
jgi:hypothetical protein